MTDGRVELDRRRRRRRVERHRPGDDPRRPRGRPAPRRRARPDRARRLARPARVKAAILACFADRTTGDWTAGPLTFRDRAAVPPRDDLAGGAVADRARRDGRPPRRPPRRGRRRDAAVVRQRRRVGRRRRRWSTRTCSSARAPRSGRGSISRPASPIGGVLEPPGARPVIVEDDAFVGAGSALLEGVLVGRGAVIGAGVTLTGTSRLYDLVRGPGPDRDRRRAAGRPAGRGRRPGRAASPGRSRRSTGCRVSVALLVKDRDAGHRRPGRPRGRPPMSLDLDARPRRGRPPARNEILRAGRLGGLAPDELAARFGTPLYVYDLDVIDRQVGGAAGRPAAAASSSPTRSRPTRRWRSSPTSGRLGLGADVASGGELATALRAGIDAGPDRDDRPGQARRRAARPRSRPGSARSPSSRPASSPGSRRSRPARGRRQPVLLRAAVTEDAPARTRPARRRRRGRQVRDGRRGPRGLRRGERSASPHLELLGLHAFGASNVLDAGALVDARRGDRPSGPRAGAARPGSTLRLVDAGGGLGIPYEPHEESLDLVGLGAGLAAITDGLGDRPVLAEARLLLEPGRFLVGPAGAYVARVVDRKTVDGSIVVILDGGVHHVLRPALVGQEHRIRSLVGAPGDAGAARLGAGHGRRAAVLGARRLQPGARSWRRPRSATSLAVLDVGAYGFTESMPLFLSHPIPAEVAVRDGRAALIRPRQDPGEWLDRQVAARLGASRAGPSSVASSSSFRPPHRYRRPSTVGSDRPGAGAAPPEGTPPRCIPTPPTTCPSSPSASASASRCAASMAARSRCATPLASRPRDRAAARSSCRARACSRPSTPTLRLAARSPAPARSRRPRAWPAIAPSSPPR